MSDAVKPMLAAVSFRRFYSCIIEYWSRSKIMFSPFFAVLKSEMKGLRQQDVLAEVSSRKCSEIVPNCPLLRHAKQA